SGREAGWFGFQDGALSESRLLGFIQQNRRPIADNYHHDAEDRSIASRIIRSVSLSRSQRDSICLAGVLFSRWTSVGRHVELNSSSGGIVRRCFAQGSLAYQTQARRRFSMQSLRRQLP